MFGLGYIPIQVMLLGYVGFILVPLLAIIFGIVGIVKDRVVVMGIIGMNLALVYFIILAINFFMFMLYPPWYYYP